VDGSYVAECFSGNTVTQGDTWEELRANVKKAMKAYFYDGPKPKSIWLHLVRDEVLAMG
jgi:predicted RNase H-like HicB family nuclease